MNDAPSINAAHVAPETADDFGPRRGLNYLVKETTMQTASAEVVVSDAVALQAEIAATVRAAEVAGMIADKAIAAWRSNPTAHNKAAMLAAIGAKSRAELATGYLSVLERAHP